MMKLNKTILAIVFIALSVCQESYAKDINTTLHAYANNLLNAKDQSGGYITAISLAAQCGNSAPAYVFAGRNGIKDFTPIKENSIFQIGSITKSFIAIVILQLAKEYGFSIDDLTILAKYFPEYPKWSHITLRQLMDMTSGIPGNENNLPDDIFKKFTLKEYTSKIEPKKILDLTYALPVHFKPGAAFEYSNTNYILLGQFIKKVTHHTPEDEVTNRIIKKLGLRNTYFPIDKEDGIPNINKSQLVHGYVFYSKASHPYPFIINGADVLPWSLSYASTAGAMISTPQDINSYLHALFDKAGLLHQYQKQLTTFVSRKTGKPISFPTIVDRQGYGLGIMGYYWDKAHPIIYLYNGLVDGFNFAWLIDPKSRVYLVFAVNSHSEDVITIDTALELLSKVEKSCQINGH